MISKFSVILTAFILIFALTGCIVVEVNPDPTAVPGSATPETAETTVPEATGTPATPTPEPEKELSIRLSDTLIPDNYNGSFSEGYGVTYDTVDSGGYSGYTSTVIDMAGNTYCTVEGVIEGRCSDGLFVRWSFENANYSFINIYGEQQFGKQWEFVYGFTEGLAWVNVGGVLTIEATGGDWAVIDKTGAVVVDYAPFDTVQPFSEGLALVSRDGKYGFMDTAGNFVLPLVYDYAGSFSEGLAYVIQNGKQSVIDTQGNKVFDLSDDILFVNEFHNGLAAFNRDGKYGFLNTDGTVFIEAQYDYASDFSEGVAVTVVGGEWMESDGIAITGGVWKYIDTSGTAVPQPEFESSYGFHDGLSVCRAGGELRYLELVYE